MTAHITIRPAYSADAPLLLSMIRELAAYERMSDLLEVTEERLQATLFCEHPCAESFIGLLDDEPAGFALFFHNYSTFLGRPGLYLEDLFVRPGLRRSGVGKALLLEVARTARERNCGRLEWTVLDWNTPAIEFYESCGAKPLSEWVGYRMDRPAMEAFVGGSS